MVTSNYFTLNNPSRLSIKSSTSFASSYSGVQYTTEINNLFFHVYTTGGIRNNTPKALMVLINYHIPVMRASASSSSYAYCSVRRHDNSTSTYTDYFYVGTVPFRTGSNLTVITGSAWATIPANGGYMAIFIGSDSGTLTSSTSGRVELIPMGLG